MHTDTRTVISNVTVNKNHGITFPPECSFLPVNILKLVAHTQEGMWAEGV
jgi:hypothetical protein